MRAGGPACFFSLLLAGCGSKSNVTLSASLDNASVTVARPSPLVTELTGGFTLHVELGAEAADGTDVAIGNFLLVPGDSGTSPVTLKLTGAEAFPVHLAPGANSSIPLTIATSAGDPAQGVDEATAAALCAGAAQISGNLTDSAQGDAITPVSSGPLSVGGCGP